MSTIRITDKKGGVYEAAIDFSYGECERLPFNILRRVRARLRVLGGGGLTATATFNIRNPQESNAFLEILGLFAGDGGRVGRRRARNRGHADRVGALP